MTTYHGDRARRLLIAKLSANCATSGSYRGREKYQSSITWQKHAFYTDWDTGIFGFGHCLHLFFHFCTKNIRILVWFLFYLILGKNKIEFSDLKFGEVVCFSFPVSLRNIRASTTSPAHVFSDFAGGFLSFLYSFFFFKRTVLQLIMHHSAILHTLCSCNNYLIQIYI